MQFIIFSVVSLISSTLELSTYFKDISLIISISRLFRTFWFLALYLNVGMN